MVDAIIGDMTNHHAETFRDIARRHFGTVSGTPENGYRVAVTGKRMFRQIAALAEQYGGTVAPDSGRFPQLVRIAFEPTTTTDTL